MKEPQSFIKVLFLSKTTQTLSDEQSQCLELLNIGRGDAVAKELEQRYFARVDTKIDKRKEEEVKI